ncbi:MAG: carbohydrate binding domain-containing protein [Verrucomicrobia bacterium]|jgi:hypothetical protein|nr:carbohydrate binding domain-containing protein [Verrucomicrobiota bacterium]
MRRILAVLCVAGLVPAAANAQNLLSNPGIELGTGANADIWTEIALNNSTMERSASMPHTGIYSMFGNVTSPDGSPGKAEMLQLTPTGSIVPGNGYTISFWAKGSVGPGAVAWYDGVWLDTDGSHGGGVKGGTGLNNIFATLSGTYQPYSGTFTAPAGADAIQLSIRMEGGAFIGSGGQLYVDDVSITVVPEPTTLALAGLGAGALLVFRRRH